MKLGTPLPDGVLRLDAPEVESRSAFQQLNDLVRKVGKQLAALGQDPVAIASSPNRFDDAWTYPWRAVRCGNFFSEKESYVRTFDLDRDILTAPPEAKMALALLQELDEAGWRDLFAKAFGTEMPDQTLSIVVQDRLTWLVLSANNLTYDDGDPVFAIWDDAEMSYFGEAKERFDWAIQQQIPLVFRDEGEELEE